MMQASSLLGSPPGARLEYLAQPDGERLAETLVAFANADGGIVLLGVRPGGQVLAGVQSEEVEGALRLALTACRPPIPSEWEQVESSEGTVIAIHVPRSTELHSLADGRVLIRVGHENRPLSGDAIRHLAATKSSADFEAEVVAGTSAADLDGDLIQEYVNRRVERQRRPITDSPETLLQEIGSLDPQGLPTVSGLLLFGKKPQRYLPQAGLLFIRFSGTEPRGPEGLPGYGRREELTGPLPHLIERAWQIIWSEMRVEGVVRDLVREERTEYPPFPVREALVNSVAHRDYRLNGRRIEVRMFDDRLEVISPGGLPGFMTLDNLVEEHYSRNPRLVDGLFQWGLIEALGLGVDRMIEDMVQAGHPPPAFHATSYAFSVTLKNVLERHPIPRWEHNMSERQMRALAYLQEYGRITNRDYRELCPDVSPETLRLDLVDLSHRGILLKIGSKRGTYYILK